MAGTLVAALAAVFALRCTVAATGGACAGLNGDALVRCATALHHRLTTIDTHIDIPRQFAPPAIDFAGDGDAQVDLARMRAGGLDMAFLSVAIGQGQRDAVSYARARHDALRMIEAIRSMVEHHPPELALASSAEEVPRILASGRLAVAIGLENGFPLGGDLAILGRLHALGVRYITLVHIGHNALADSDTPNFELEDSEAEHGGLSPYGRAVIAEMNRLGIIVDVSHASRQAMLEAVSVSRAPVIASHSGVRALADHARNLDDVQLRALRDRDGVVHIVAYSAYVRPDPPERIRAIRELGEAMGLRSHSDWGRAADATIAKYGRRLLEIDARWPRATVADYVDHIDYVVRLIGIDHVGIGSDFYAGGGAPSGGLAGWMEVTETPQVTLELIRRGYSETDIAKIWSGNLLRVWRDVERVAAEPAESNR